MGSNEIAVDGLSGGVKFRGSSAHWPEWGVNNQRYPEEYPLVPDADIEESLLKNGSVIGLTSVLPYEIPTKLPRLPWGSHNALIVNLVSKGEELPETREEVESVERLLCSAGFDVTCIEVNETGYSAHVSGEPDDDVEVLRSALASNHWDIVHFCGHMEVSDGQFIGTTEKLNASQFVASCCRAAPPRLVVLNACQSGDMSSDTDVAGISGPIAEQFCLRGVDAVIATRWKIHDAAARIFSDGFWDSIVSQLPSFSSDDQLTINVKDAVLSARQGLKTAYPEMDACWLAYAVFESRQDGCIIPSQKLLIPRDTPGGTHPPYINIQEFTKLCEHLAPGGAGIYLMEAPACSGKTTSALLALQTLRIPEELFGFTYNSLRHDESLDLIAAMHEALTSLDDALLLPLVLDDAELLMNHSESEIHEQILEISKHAPLLLLMRKRVDQPEYYRLFLKQFEIETDGLRVMNPNVPDVDGMIAYLEQFDVNIKPNECQNLLVRMRGSLYSAGKFAQSAREGDSNLDLLEPPQEMGFLNRLSSLTNDEQLCIQIVSSLITPVASKIRCHLAWEILRKHRLVNSSSNIFQTLCSFDILREWMDDKQMPTMGDIDEKFLSTIPQTMKEIEIPSKLVSILKEEGAPEVVLAHPWIGELFTGYTLNNSLTELIRALPEHPMLKRAQETAVTCFKTFNVDQSMQRLFDGYDQPEMLLRIIQPKVGEKVSLDSKFLLREILLGANAELGSLDQALEKWLKSPRKFLNAIQNDRNEICSHLSKRVPSLNSYTIHALGKFIQQHHRRFPPAEKGCAELLFSLHTEGSTITKNELWESPEWMKLRENSRQTLMSASAQMRNKVLIRESAETAKKLLFLKPHHKRERELIEASSASMLLESDYRVDLVLLHSDYCQILMRHLLFRGSPKTLFAFRKHIDKLESSLKLPSQNGMDDSKQVDSASTSLLFFRIMLGFFEARIELRKQKRPDLELSRIRDLMEAAEQLGQVDNELRKGAMTEAASRMISLSRRKDIRWSKPLVGIRSKLFRELRLAVFRDFRRLPKWITEELATHLVKVYDPHGNDEKWFDWGYQMEESSKMSHKQWNFYIEQEFRMSSRTPVDRYPNFEGWLNSKSAPNQLTDSILGPVDVMCTCRVASLMWASVADLGELARPVAKFAITFWEDLTPEQLYDVNTLLEPPSS